ncbi:MAG TPA: phytanoyl-CoA dioxygenase family protein [Micromonosporaceae bacterium]|jgi:ectoine hydroxylase-related dioxygenase (phytanoyl-CoA dioxygenase family)
MTITAPTATKTGTSAPSAELREQFERDGYLVIKGALTPDEVDYYANALDEVYEAEVAAGKIAPSASMHTLGAVANCPASVNLIDHPATFPFIWSVLGWNIHIYHSHLDVHPKIVAPKPYFYEWHQDGGRQNRELETDPRPRLSVKLAYWLSDVSETGRGNFKVVPGSHLINRIDGPPRRDVVWPEPAGSIEVCASPGDVVFFDRRLWHARTNNYSDITRKGMFFAYSHRWSYGRDENNALYINGQFAEFTPVQRQLLGAPLAGPGQIAGDHQWGHYPDTTPLYGYLKDNNLFDPSYPPLIP